MKGYIDIQAKDLQEILNTYNAVDKGSYYKLTCPDCQKHEAFMYKNAPNFITCHRANECGSSTRIKYESDIDVNKAIAKSNHLPLKNYDTSKLYETMEYIAENTYQEYIKDFRGFDKELQRKLLINHISLDHLAKVHPDVFEKKYTTDYWKERDILIPIVNKGQVERLLCRSSNPNIQPKEIQLTFKNPSRDYQSVLNKAGHNVVFMTESVIDAYSFLEVNKEISVLGLTGAMRINQVEDFILRNKDFFNDKVFALAFDNDVAGQKTESKIISFLNENNFNSQKFNLGEFKDPNDFLMLDRLGFEKEVTRTIQAVNSNVQKSISDNLDEVKTKMKNKDTSQSIIEMKDEFNNAIDEIKQGVVEAFENNNSFANTLSNISSSNNYSMNNIMLLQQQLMQRGIQDDLIVNSFKQWQDKGVKINKGAKGLSIIAPGTYKAFKDEQDNIISVKKANENQKRLIKEGKIEVFEKQYFRLKKDVFHYTDTNYSPTEIYKGLIKVNDTKDVEAMYTSLKEVAIKNDLAVVERNLGKTSGALVSDDNKKMILINSELETSHKLKTLIHEISHNELSHIELNTDRVKAELEAESIAYMCSKQIGMDTSEYSFEYLKSYSKDKEIKDLTDTLSSIQFKYDKVNSKYIQKAFELKNENVKSIKTTASLNNNKVNEVVVEVNENILNNDDFGVELQP